MQQTFIAANHLRYAFSVPNICSLKATNEPLGKLHYYSGWNTSMTLLIIHARRRPPDDEIDFRGTRDIL